MRSFKDEKTGEVKSDFILIDHSGVAKLHGLPLEDIDFPLDTGGKKIEEIVKNGWRTRKSVAIIGVVSVANFAGTILGVTIGTAITHH
jgi:hypothetical protein